MYKIPVSTPWSFINIIMVMQTRSFIKLSPDMTVGFIIRQIASKFNYNFRARLKISVTLSVITPAVIYRIASR